MKSAVIIGCGKRVDGKEGWAIGHNHSRNYLAAFPDIELYGVDINEENLAAFGETFSVPKERLFTSTEAFYAAVTPDAASICTWPKLHCPQVIEAAQAGVKAITCEKPMALDGSEIDDMIGVCKRKGARLAIGHQRRYINTFILAKQLIQDGAIGGMRVLEARVGDGWDILSWSVHWFDMANFLLGENPTHVLAGIDHTGTRRYQHAVEDNSVILIEYDGGSQGVFITGPAEIPTAGVRVVGEKGLLWIRGKGVDVYTDAGYEKHEAEPNTIPEFGMLFQDLWKSVGDPEYVSVCGVENCAIATRLAYLAHESGRLAKRLPVDTEVGYAPLEVMEHASKSNQSFGKVTLLADNHHADPVTGEGGREGLRDALLAVGAESVYVVPAEQREPTPQDLDGADMLVIYHTVRTSTPEVRKLIGDWINSGKPVVVSHCGIGAYADWPEYRQAIGRYWVWGGEELPPSGHPHVPCDIKVAPGVNWNPGFDEAWLPRDEVYIDLAVGGEVEELATCTYDDDKVAHIAWQAKTQPNVVTFSPGHRRDVWGLEVMRNGLRASLAMVAKK